MSFPQVEILTGPCDGPKDPVLKSDFKFDDFQNHAFESIESDKDVFAAVPTSGGKTAVGKYAIVHAVKKLNRKVIYTTPIKALSNQKYKEFSKEFDFKIGLLTGDKKIDVEESMCVVATAEILLIALYGLTNKIETTNNVKLSDDFVNSIGCVVMDEVHFMNDKERGYVWETTIILLNRSIQLVMLSATVSYPERFGAWVSWCRQRPLSIVSVKDRIIPLQHFVFVDNQLFKVIDGNNTFSGEQLNIAKNKHMLIKKEREKAHKSKIDSNLVPNIVRFLKKNDLLQAIFFSFSKANCEKYSYSITDSLVDHMERSEIEKMFYNEMLPYKKEYENVPQVITLKELLLRGVAFHHAGMLPVLKVVVENIFEAGLIKVLFATETFAVGINGSTRTIVMGELEKFTEEKGNTGKLGKRFITTAEYKQMSGRAGRRGKDTIGNVILLPMFDFPSERELMSVAFGDVPSIGSRFNWSYQFYLKTIQSNVTSINNFFNKSLVNTENVMILSEMLDDEKQILNELVTLTEEIINCSENIDPVRTVIKYEDKQLNNSNSLIKITLDKKQQQESKKAKTLVDGNPILKSIYNCIKKQTELKHRHSILIDKINANKNFINGYSCIIGQILTQWGYLETSDTVTIKGVIAAKINECNPIILTEMITRDFFANMTPQEIIALVSVFTDPIKTSSENDFRDLSKFNGTLKLHTQIANLIKIIEEMTNTELNIAGGTTFANWKITADYVDIAFQWASGISVPEILILLAEYGEYEGNFVKNMLKICNIIKDIQIICTSINKIELLPILEQTESLILRGIVFYI
jgi:superfamily II RNA helicase